MNAKTKMLYNPIMEYYTAFKKDGNSDISSNREETWEQYAKWNKPVTERRMLYDSTYAAYLQQFNS